MFRVLRSSSQWCCATRCPTPRTPPLHRWCHRGLLSCSMAIPTPPTPKEVGEIQNLFSDALNSLSTRHLLNVAHALSELLSYVTVLVDRVDVALSPEHISRPPPEAPPCAPPITPPSPGPGAPGWDQEVVCIQPSRSTSPPESLEHPPEEPRNVSAYTHPGWEINFLLHGENILSVSCKTINGNSRSLCLYILKQHKKNQHERPDLLTSQIACAILRVSLLDVLWLIYLEKFCD